MFLAVFSVFYVHVRSDGHGAKRWRSTDAGIQSHVLKAVAAILGSTSNEALRLAPVKVNSPVVPFDLLCLLSCAKL